MEAIQVQIALQPEMYNVLERIARQEQQSVSQTVQHLLQEKLVQADADTLEVDISAASIAQLAMAGQAWDWLADEPDLYDDACGEAV